VVGDRDRLAKVAGDVDRAVEVRLGDRELVAAPECRGRRR
jgi:hypothetical protein